MAEELEQEIVELKKRVDECREQAEGRPLFPDELKLDIIDACEKHGNSYVCNAIGLAISQPYVWKTKLAKQRRQKKRAERVETLQEALNDIEEPAEESDTEEEPVQGVEQAEEPEQAEEAVEGTPTQKVACEIQLPNGTVIRIFE